MFISVRRYEVEAHLELPDVCERVEAEFVPQINELPGLITYYLVETDTHELTSVSIFDTEQACAESDARAAAWTREAFQSHELTRIGLTEGEIVVAR